MDSDGEPALNSHTLGSNGKELWAVGAAVIGNLTVFFIKLWIFHLCNSSAMLSEAIHSFADFLNQLLILAGILFVYWNFKLNWKITLLRVATIGYGTLTVSVIIHSFLKFGVWRAISHRGYGIGVLVVSCLIEGFTLLIAYFAMNGRNGQSLWKWLKGNDAGTVFVFIEDSIAVWGNILAACGIILSHYNFLWDGIFSILIGISMAIATVLLIRKNFHR